MVLARFNSLNFLKPLYVPFLMVFALTRTVCGQGVTFPFETIMIEQQTGKQLSLRVEVATTPQQQQQGLMFRQSMPHDQGMIFFFNQPKIVSMWMRNTYIPLDMLFIDKQGLIIAIQTRVIPQSDNLIVSPKPSAAVLEINGGASDKFGIQVGDRVLHPFFTTAKP